MPGLSALSLLLTLLVQPVPDGRLVTARHVEIAVRPPGTSAFPAGAEATLRLEIRPKAGRAVYAPGQAGYIGVTITFPEGAGIEAGAMALPPSQTSIFEPTGERLQVFRSAFTVEQPVRFTRATTLPLTATLRYQACDDTICYRPETVTIEWTEN